MYTHSDALSFLNALSGLDEVNVGKRYIFINKLDTWINLNHVTYIKFDQNKKRIIFSFDYSIQLRNDKTKDKALKVIPDYLYLDCSSIDEFNQYEKIFKDIPKSNYEFHTYEDENVSLIINYNKVATIKYKENRVIIGFNTPASFSDGKNANQITGYFLFIDMPKERLEACKKSIFLS